MPHHSGIRTISGPSGSGKTTLLNALLKYFPQWKVFQRVTTRKPRPTDAVGEYDYVTSAEFERLICDGEFMWWFELHGNRYGAPNTAITRGLWDEVSVADLSPQSVEFLFVHIASFEKLPNRMRSIYLDISDEQELRRRLSERHEANIEQRIAECRTWGEEVRHSSVPFHIIDALQPPEEVLRQAIAFFNSSFS